MGYFTHQAPLIAAFLNTKGDVLELGAGNFSTPLLHELCRFHKRRLVTCDATLEWMEPFKTLSEEWHEFRLVHNWDGIIGHFGLVLVDHVADRRDTDIRRLRASTDVFVVHDSEKLKYYNYHAVFQSFAYRYEYTLFPKKTMLLSDVIDVTTFFR